MNSKLEQTNTINLSQRKKLIITGINKIDSLNDQEFLIDTKLGPLLVTGVNLSMKHLDIESGELWIEGTINSIEYLDKETKKKEKNSFFGKIFK